MIVKCPSCNRRYRVKDRLAGRKVTCVACGHIARIPNQERVTEVDRLQRTLGGHQQAAATLPPDLLDEMPTDQGVARHRSGSSDSPTAETRMPVTVSPASLGPLGALSRKTDAELSAGLAVAAFPNFLQVSHTDLEAVGRSTTVRPRNRRRTINYSVVDNVISVVGSVVDIVREKFVYLVGCLVLAVSVFMLNLMQKGDTPEEYVDRINGARLWRDWATQMDNVGIEIDYGSYDARDTFYRSLMRTPGLFPKSTSKDARRKFDPSVVCTSTFSSCSPRGILTFGTLGSHTAVPFITTFQADILEIPQWRALQKGQEVCFSGELFIKPIRVIDVNRGCRSARLYEMRIYPKFPTNISVQPDPIEVAQVQALDAAGNALAANRKECIRPTVGELIQILRPNNPGVPEIVRTHATDDSHASNWSVRGHLYYSGISYRAGAARLLGEYGSVAAPAIAHLKKAYQTDDPKVAEEAHRALPQVGDGTAVETTDNDSLMN